MDFLGGLFGAAGQVAGASITADAIQNATKMQIDALNKQKQFVYNNLDPATISPQITSADIAAAQNQLKLQGTIDPNLLAARYQAEAAQEAQLGQVGVPGSQVAQQATSEALAGTPGMEQAKDSLVQAAQKELNAGATLPPDVEAQLVQAGLEQSGAMTGGPGNTGAGGQILRTVLGTAGIQLQQQRQTHAASLLSSAQNLEASRQNILQGLFPQLTNQQLASLGAQQSAIGLSQNLTPTVGPTGTDIANIWLARVGATNQLTQQAATIGAQGVMGQANAYSNIAGALGKAGSSAIPYINNILSPTANSYQGGSMGSSQGQITGADDWSNPANF